MGLTNDLDLNIIVIYAKLFKYLVLSIHQRTKESIKFNIMKLAILKHKKIIISIFIVFVSIYLYSNKSYSLYELNYIDKVDNDEYNSKKEYYSKRLSLEKNSISQKTFIVKKNQNLSVLFKKVGYTAPYILLKKSKGNCFYNLKINDELIFEFLNNKLKSVKRKSKKIDCFFNAKENAIQSIDQVVETETEKFVFFNNISNSFYNSALKSGMSANEIMSLADIFGWDIDFSIDIRSGDSFGVFIERRFVDSNYVSSEIKYAVFKNQKRIIEAYRYNDRFYDIKGNPLRKQFLRAPIDFYRISSKFNRKRLHPIFKKVRPHLGTDYAAPKGTPIYTTGDGTVIHKGRKGGYGKTVIIRHGNIYTTLYAHLSKYHKKLYVGKKVKQKEIIGYVGSTGYSTGPHVHYEFRVRGVHKNSLKVKFKKGKKLNKEYLIEMVSNHKGNNSIYSWLKKNYSHVAYGKK